MADPLQAFIEQNKGLLSFEPNEEDRKKAMTYGLIGAGLGILSANAHNPRGAGFGGAVGGAMPGLQMYQQTLQNAPKERMQQFSGLLQLQKLKKDIEAQDALKNFTSGQQSNFQGAQGALTDGAAVGDVGPTVTNAARIPQQTQVPNFAGLLAAGIPPETVKALMADWELRNPKREVSGGYVYDPRSVAPNSFLPRIEINQQGQGIGVTPNQGGLPTVSPLPGSLDTFTAFQKASKATDADYRLRDVPQSDGTTRLMTEGDFIRNQSAPRQDPLASLTPAERAAVDRLQSDLKRGVTGSITVPASQSSAGQIPTSAVVGVSPSDAQKSADRERAVGAVKKESEFPQARLQIQTQVADLDRLANLTQEIIKAPALDRSVGLVGAVPSIPGSEASNVDVMINSLKAQVSGLKLQAMRNASKTGGAVGQVTEKEWPRLENMIVALDSKMSPEKFREKASELILAIEDAKRNINMAFESEYGPRTQPAPPPQRRGTDKNVMRFDSSGRRIP